MNTKELIDFSMGMQQLDIYKGTGVWWMAQHILATVKPDDDDPLTDDWLSEIGDIVDDVICIAIIRKQVNDPNMSLDGNELGEAYFRPPETRGQFRELCRGLGIELKENN